MVLNYPKPCETTIDFLEFVFLQNFQYQQYQHISDITCLVFVIIQYHYITKCLIASKVFLLHVLILLKK